MPATTVRVTTEHIRESVAGDCFRCAVARAMQEATGDSEANVHESDFVIYLEVHGRFVVAPQRVREFVWTYDDLFRDEGGKPVVTPELAKLYPELKPFSFKLPGPKSPGWEERCYGCEAHFRPGELDDEGYCPECQEEGA